MHRLTSLSAAIAACVASSAAAANHAEPAAAAPIAGVRADLDLPYAGTEHPRQRLDLQRPADVPAGRLLPVVAFIHGGAWRAGDRTSARDALVRLAADGDYATAAIGYRLTTEEPWPAQLHDCKAAIRWLRANAERFGLDPDRIGVMGVTAGGHLAAMLGTTGADPDLEGALGPHAETSSRVACVVDQSGPSDLAALADLHGEPGSPLAALFGGGPVREHLALARRASPVAHASADDPPFLILHGTADEVVPLAQAERLDATLDAAGVESILVPVTAAGHRDVGGPAVQERIDRFFARHLLGRRIEVPEGPIVGAAGPPGPAGESGAAAPAGADPRAAFDRAVELFLAAEPVESATLFDEVAAAVPAAEPQLWQRGIALYYAERYADGRRQFELHRRVNPDDIENPAWHFLCVARLEGVDAARRAMLPVGEDPRVPMREILELFAGRGDEKAVLAAAEQGPEEERRNQRCYAHLYLGLHAEARGDAEAARRHITAAAGPHRMDHYMGRVAVVHAILRGWQPPEPAATPGPDRPGG